MNNEQGMLKTELCGFAILNYDSMFNIFYLLLT
jgi:hypothetical protein